MQVKRLEDFFDNNKKWISVNTSIMSIGEWTTLTNGANLDRRLYDFYREKVLDKTFQSYTDAEFNEAVTSFVNSHVYELDGLYHTTTADYNPIDNYNMQESGRDETRSNSTGSTTEYATSYNSATENKTGKSEAGGSSSTAFIHSFSRSGNIGVTTTQQMLQSERDIVKFDFIGYVAELIVNNFTCSSWDPAGDFLEVVL